MGVEITIANGALGRTTQTNDGICGMVLTGFAQAAMTLNTPFVITSYEALLAKGVTEGTNGWLLRQVRDYYLEAGKGAILYLLIRDAETYLAEFATSGSVNSCEALLNYAQGKIRLLGIMTDDAAIATATGDPTDTGFALNAGVESAILGMQEIAETYALERQQPFRCIIGGTSFTNEAGELDDLVAKTHNRVAVLIGDTQNGPDAALGRLLGRLAKVPVQRQVSRVRTGPVLVTSAFVGDIAVESPLSEMETIKELGYITWQQYPQTSGYYWSRATTACPTSDDYHLLVSGRVVDKAQIITYRTYLQEVDDEIPVNADGSGTMNPSYRVYLENIIVQALQRNMRGEISSAVCEIDPDQDVLATDEVLITVGVVPVGYASALKITLGLSRG